MRGMNRIHLKRTKKSKNDSTLQNGPKWHDAIRPFFFFEEIKDKRSYVLYCVYLRLELSRMVFGGISQGLRKFKCKYKTFTWYW